MLYAGSKGIKISIELNIIGSLNTAEATTVQLLYKKPSGYSGVVDCSLENNGKTLVYVINDSNFLNEIGRWVFQPYLKFNNYEVYGTPFSIWVERPISN